MPVLRHCQSRGRWRSWVKNEWRVLWQVCDWFNLCVCEKSAKQNSLPHSVMLTFTDNAFLKTHTQKQTSQQRASHF